MERHLLQSSKKYVIILVSRESVKRGTNYDTMSVCVSREQDNATRQGELVTRTGQVAPDTEVTLYEYNIRCIL